MNKDRLVAFLYLLMRDELPTGRVVTIINELNKDATSYKFTSKHLAAYATELADRLLEAPEGSKS